jgi:serine/threonine protein kinase
MTTADAIADGGLTALLRPELELIRPLGSGSTADVYLAREAGLQRLVAVKVMHRELVSDPIVRRRFVREAQSAARVHHPNVTAVYRIGELPGGVPYIVMEYIDGRTVRDVIDAAGAFGLDEGRSVLASVASALTAIHECGVVHRDVQPGNIYIENRTGRAVLGDFGIAALLDSGSAAVTRLTQTGVRLGDTRYMSPEQLRGEKPTECSDVYAFGILAYEVLTAHGPYAGTSDSQLLVAHIRDEPLRLATQRTDLEPGLARILENCLAKEPNRRPRPADLANRLTSRTDRGSEPTEDQGRLGEFLAELRRRRVYQVLMAYGAFAAAVFAAAQVVYDAFDLSQGSYQVVVLLTLAGFPVAMVLSWLYDVTAAGIRRTEASAATRRITALKWIGLAGSVVAAAVIGWLLLRTG